jgi:multidrug efflux pump subunit AcrB
MSISVEDMSKITVFLDPNLKRSSVDNVIQDIREVVSQVPRLPEGIEGHPTVSREKTSELPILDIGITSDQLSYRQLRETARIMEKKLKEIQGISTVTKYGYHTREIKIEIDPDKIKEFQIPIRDIMYAIQNRNIRSTGGTLESFTGNKNIVTLAQFRKPEEVGDVIIRSNYEGYCVKVKDLAEITDSFQDEDVISRINGKKMILFSINKQESADIIATSERIKSFLEKEKQNLPEHVQIHYSNDLSRYVQASFDVVYSNGLMGFILVLIILTIFLSFRTSFWVALGIPVSLMGTIALLPLFNVNLDVITLTAMILVLGIIVDDAIIISETIYHEWESGSSPIEAAVKGLKRVFLPVLTTILTTFLAFVPMFFIKGELGKFIYVIPLVITLSLTISFLEGIIALPAHIVHGISKEQQQSLVNRRGWSWLLKVKTKLLNMFSKRTAHKTQKNTSKNKWFQSLRGRYENFMHTVLKRRYPLVGVFVFLLMVALFYASFGLKLIVFPTEGAEEFAVYMETPVGTNLQTTSHAVAQVEKLIDALPKDEIDSYMTLIGNQEGYINQDHIAMIRVNLRPYSTRSRNAQSIAEELRSSAAHIKNFTSFRCDVAEAGPSPEKPISIRIVGSDNTTRNSLAHDVQQYLKTIEGVKEVSRDDNEACDQVEILFDFPALARMGITVADAAQTIRVAYDGEVATRGAIP